MQEQLSNTLSKIPLIKADLQALANSNDANLCYIARTLLRNLEQAETQLTRQIPRFTN